MHVFGYADTQSTVEDIDEFLMSEILILGHWSHIVFDKPKHFKGMYVYQAISNYFSVRNR